MRVERLAIVRSSLIEVNPNFLQLGGVTAVGRLEDGLVLAGL